MKRIVVLISGRGSNMVALADACVAEQWPAVVAAVISNRPDAAGLQAAAARGLETRVVDHRTFLDRASFDRALAEAIDAVGADLLVLAGFMRILTPDFVTRYAGRLINIHPSLLPAFGGLHTHRRALDAGCKLAGATVHFVTTELDHGPIIAQAMVPVERGEDETALAKRVLAMEHRMLPSVVRWMVRDELIIDGLRIVHPSESQLFC